LFRQPSTTGVVYFQYGGFHPTDFGMPDITVARGNHKESILIFLIGIYVTNVRYLNVRLIISKALLFCIFSFNPQSPIVRSFC
jgi:hypothetical protein